MEDASQDDTSAEKRKWEKFTGGIFLGSVTGMAMLFGFGTTIAMAKRQDPTHFSKGVMKNKNLPESGIALAMRALGYGTLYSVTGVGLICFIFWKAIGAKDFQEFRQILGNRLPKIPKNEPQGRTEFSSFRELINYIIEEDVKRKK